MAGLAVLAAPAVAQQDYPNRTVTLVVPYPPGGGVDVLARVVAEKLSGSLGQQVIVDNRVGGSGLVGTRAAIRRDRKSTRLNSSHIPLSRMPSSA